MDNKAIDVEQSKGGINIKVSWWPAIIAVVSAIATSAWFFYEQNSSRILEIKHLESQVEGLENQLKPLKTLDARLQVLEARFDDNLNISPTAPVTGGANNQGTVEFTLD